MSDSLRAVPRPLHLADVFRKLGVSQSHGLWSCSGRNEARNTVVLQLDGKSFRGPTASEKEAGIEMVHEFAYQTLQIPWLYMRDDLAYAIAEDSHVRVIVFNHDDERWEVLPNIGKVVKLDAVERTGKVVLYG